MTSTLVFMEHNPISLAMRPKAPISFSNFMYRCVIYPRSNYGHEGSDLMYRSDGNKFSLKFYSDAAQITGSVFWDQDLLDEYLSGNGIMIKKALVDLGDQQRVAWSSGILLLENFKYTREITKTLSQRVRELFKVGTESMFHVKNQSFVHTRTGEALPRDEWIPMYRKGNILHSGEGPVTLENSTYVIV